MTNLTPSPNPEAPIAVPDNGETVVAASPVSPPPPGEGPVAPAFQALADRIEAIYKGRVQLRAVRGTAVAADAGKIDGAPLPDGTIYAPHLQGDDLLVNSGSFLFVAASPELRALDLNGQVSVLGSRLKFVTITNGAEGANPPKTQPIGNELRAIQVCKAMGIFRTTDVPNYLDGWNLDGGGIDLVADPGGMKFTVVLAQDMASIVYGVRIQAHNAATGQAIAHTSFVRNGPGSFTIGFGIDLRGPTNVEIQVWVDGRQ